MIFWCFSLCTINPLIFLVITRTLEGEKVWLTVTDLDKAILRRHGECKGYENLNAILLFRRVDLCFCWLDILSSMSTYTFHNSNSWKWQGYHFHFQQFSVVTVVIFRLWYILGSSTLVGRFFLEYLKQFVFSLVLHYYTWWVV